jgi:prepilin-type processing-associated H-X9-DG protein
LRTKQLRPRRGWAFDSYSKADGMNGVAEFGVKPYRKSGELANPTLSMVFIEESDPAYGFNDATWVLNTDPVQWVDVFAIAHGKSSTFAFADGHTEHHTWTDPRLIKVMRDAVTKGVRGYDIPGATPANPDFRWTWDRFRHRGWKPLHQ